MTLAFKAYYITRRKFLFNFYFIINIFIYTIYIYIYFVYLVKVLGKILPFTDIQHRKILRKKNLLILLVNDVKTKISNIAQGYIDTLATEEAATAASKHIPKGKCCYSYLE